MLTQIPQKIKSFVWYIPHSTFLPSSFSFRLKASLKTLASVSSAILLTSSVQTQGGIENISLPSTQPVAATRASLTIPNTQQVTIPATSGTKSRVQLYMLNGTPQGGTGTSSEALSRTKNANQATALYNVGLEQVKNQQFEASLNSFNESLLANPTYADAHLGKVYSLAQLERHEEAVKAFDEAFKYQSDCAMRHYNRACALQALGKIEEARDGFDMAISLVGLDPEDQKQSRAAKILQEEQDVAASEIETQTHIVSSDQEAQTPPLKLSDSFSQTEIEPARVKRFIAPNEADYHLDSASVSSLDSDLVSEANEDHSAHYSNSKVLKWRDEANYPSDSDADSDLASAAGSAASSNHSSESASESEVNAASDAESEALEAERKHLVRRKRALSAEPYESETTKAAQQQQTDEAAEERAQQPQSQQPQQPQEQQQQEANSASLRPAASENEQKLDRSIRKVEELKAHLAAFSGAKSIALAKSQRVTANNIIAGIERRLNLNSMAAISAGDDDETAVGDEEKDAKAVEPNTSLYINPFTSKATAKESKNSSGYGASSSGFTVGFDSQVNDLLLLGMSYTKADGHINFKSSHLGDKALIDSHFYSLYGQLVPLHQRYFLSAIAIYGKSDISSKAKRGKSGAAIGRHKAISNTLQVMAGSSKKLWQKFSVTPQLGLKYSKTKDASYTEQSTIGTPSLIVSRVKAKALEGLVGLKVDYRHNLSRNVALVPEVYGFASKAIYYSTPIVKGEVQLASKNLTLPLTKLSQSKLDLHYGTGLMLKTQNIEAGLHYDATRSLKYISHTGSLKVKINM